jgi:hypothetical protein
MPTITIDLPDDVNIPIDRGDEKKMDIAVGR